MRRIALTLYVSLASAAFGQDDQFRERQIARYLKAGDCNSADRAFREAIAAQTGGENSVADLRNGLGDLLREEGKESEARGLFSKVLNTPGHHMDAAP